MRVSQKKAATAVEMGLLLGLISISVLVMLEMTGENLSGLFGQVGNQMSTAAQGKTAWSDWVKSSSSCDVWLPSSSAVSWGQSITQTRECSGTEMRWRDVRTATGTERETETRPFTLEETQEAVGTLNYQTSRTYGSWSAWTISVAAYNCGTYSPSAATVASGTSFTQTRSCSEDQERTRDIFLQWADGSETSGGTETDSQTVTITQTRTATGTKSTKTCRYNSSNRAVMEFFYSGGTDIMMYWNGTYIGNLFGSSMTTGGYTYTLGAFAASDSRNDYYEICRE